MNRSVSLFGKEQGQDQENKKEEGVGKQLNNRILEQFNN